MSILDLHGDDLMAAASRYVNQPKPEPSSSAFSLNLTRGPQDMGGMRALVGGAGEAILQIAASASELAQAPGKRRELPGVDGSMTNDFSEVFRAAGRDLRPDAQTAHVAEQLMYQFARGATKIIGGAFAAGPAGIVAAGLEEANTQADELRRQGVDFETRAMAGGVQGAGLALAALPLVGTSLKATAGLYLAGGPGGFVAQQALTREILQGAGYEQIGAQFDPLDPVGLAVSALVPLPFVAAGVRGQRLAATARAAEDFRAGPVPSEMTGAAAAAREAFAPEVVDAARVAYAVERRAAGNPAPDAPRAADLHETAMARAEAAMSMGDAVRVSDLVPPRPIESLADFMARTKIKADPVPKEVTGDFLGFLKGLGGIDFAQKLDITGEPSGVLANPGGIFRKGGRQTDELALLSVEAGYLRDGSDSYQFVELVQEAIRGNRVLTMMEQADKLGRDQHMEMMQARIEQVEAKLRLLGVDPAPAGSNVAALEAYVREHEPRILAAALDEARAVNELSPEFDALQDRARRIAQDMADGGRTLEQYEAEVQPLSAVMRRLVQEATRAPEATPPANPEAATPTRGPRPAATEPSLPKPGAEPDAAQAAGVAARLAQIEAEFPDLMVQMDGDAAPRPLSQFLADAQREADEMAADAPLVQALAECSLLNGFN
jgi:hypothetical protein